MFFVPQVIDRRIRELCVETDICQLNTPASELKAKGYKSVDCNLIMYIIV